MTMINRYNGNKIVEAPIGFYDIDLNLFYVVTPLPVGSVPNLASPDILVLDFDKDDWRDTELYKILYIFTPDTLADALTLTIKHLQKKVLDALEASTEHENR